MTDPRGQPPLSGLVDIGGLGRWACWRTWNGRGGAGGYRNVEGSGDGEIMADMEDATRERDPGCTMLLLESLDLGADVVEIDDLGGLRVRRKVVHRSSVRRIVGSNSNTLPPFSVR
jgi:hypothetical protein